VGRRQQLAPVLLRRADVDQPEAGLAQDLVVYQSTEGADLANGPAGLISGDRSDGGLVRRQRAPLKLPLLAAPVHQLDRLVAVILEVPVRVGGEPVVVAAVEHNLRVVPDAQPVHQLGERLRADELTADRVLEVVFPVDTG